MLTKSEGGEIGLGLYQWPGTYARGVYRLLFRMDADVRDGAEPPMVSTPNYPEASSPAPQSLMFARHLLEPLSAASDCATMLAHSGPEYVRPKRHADTEVIF